MSSGGSRFLEEALKLPDEERADLAAALLESLDGPPDSSVEEAWREELALRLQEVRDGSVKLVPWQELRQKLQGAPRGEGR